MGGGNPLAGELDNVMSYLSNHVEVGNKILVIPFATEDSKLDGWFSSVKKSFEDIGIEHIKLLDYRLTNQEMQNEIKDHNILYFTGGRPEKLMESLIAKELIQAIKGFSGLMVGVSAGALVFCRDCIITKDEYYPETQVIKGLELVDFSVEVHYDGTLDEELFPLSNNRDIYAIPNGSAIFWDNEVITPIHNVSLFRKSNKQIFGED
ncbi:Type 1 glutamine amidotransferase-like domain-containing protein [Peribacillus sp. Bi96]|uniref:Type 1 glutamine amidotransferase-like domain-containing protein n=1 Tax=Peribacillus sp. Bi96 TaxID=2884273 RepID=UPI0025B73616|nr:Type 1 glutamine amidotransferase-like domain-containing protein [Peribacillus sp. Bi96]